MSHGNSKARAKSVPESRAKSAPESRAAGVTAKACEILDRRGILENPYLLDLASGDMSLEGFRRSQEQFFHAVTFFPRPMAALVARIPSPKLRLDILHNVVEEHGEFDESEFHHSTFLRFLGSIGARYEDLDQDVVQPHLRAFNATLTAACVLDELEVGVGCMGIIEQAFAPISASIGNAVVDRGWVDADDLVHYKLHAEIDERHAEEFFAVVEHSYENQDRRYFIDQGLELGAYIFDRLYRELHQVAST